MEVWPVDSLSISVNFSLKVAPEERPKSHQNIMTSIDYMVFAASTNVVTTAAGNGGYGKYGWKFY